MRQFDHIMIGFGKGSKTLAGALAAAGQSVALIEKSDKMYGGTCINVACIPTKSLEHSARLSNAAGGDFEAKAVRYREAIEEKRRLTAMLRQKNYEKAVNSHVEVLTGTASFVDDHRVKVVFRDGSEEELEGERIYINTGAGPFLPPIDGLKESRFVYTSETLMEVDVLPKRLAIIGGGYIGLEFASYFANFGSQVTVIQNGETFIPKEDREVAAAVLKSFEDREITVLRGADTRSVKDEGARAVLTLVMNGVTKTLEAEAVLVAAGRRPNVEGLDLEAAGVELTARGAVQTDEQLRTSAQNIFAMGDVAGGMQFTYISLDDYRIVKSAVLGDKGRTTHNRGQVSYSVFLDPPLSRAGLSEEEALQQGYEVKKAVLPAAAIPKAQVLRRTTGVLKAVVDARTDKILGVHLFCEESHEMINLVKMAMDAGLPYTVLRDSIYTHPTMTEALNDLFGLIK